MWHDHSSISGHSHLLVVVTPIYDPAFYYSPDEMEERTGVRVDVPTLVEHPEIHIIARSGSSLSDQSLFNMCRQECLQGLSDTICTKDGIPIRDVVRFFHGDGPAQQFEAGHKVGGTYSCVGCGSKTERFDDFSYCHYAMKRSYGDCQEFVTKGIAWKQRGKHYIYTHTFNPFTGMFYLRYLSLQKSYCICSLNTKKCLL